MSREDKAKHGLLGVWSLLVRGRNWWGSPYWAGRTPSRGPRDGEQPQRSLLSLWGNRNEPKKTQELLRPVQKDLPRPAPHIGQTVEPSTFGSELLEVWLRINPEMSKVETSQRWSREPG